MRGLLLLLLVTLYVIASRVTLHVDKILVDSVFSSQQFVVASCLQRFTLVEADDFVRVLDSGQPVGDDHGGPSCDGP